MKETEHQAAGRPRATTNHLLQIANISNTSAAGFADSLRAVLRPAVHAGVDRMPVTEPLGQATPLAILFGYVQDCVQNLQIGQAHIDVLHRLARLDHSILRFGNPHVQVSHGNDHIVLTGPNWNFSLHSP